MKTRAAHVWPPHIQAQIDAYRAQHGAPPSTAPKSSGGKAADLGDQFYRSLWERNYARYLNWLLAQKRVAGWAYEPHEFWFPGIERGTRSYLPDFRVDALDGTHAWHEVKGWLDPQSKTRMKRMAQFFPAEKVILIDAAWFRASKQIAAVVPGWETGEKASGERGRRR